MANTDKLLQLEANIDDTTPEILAYTMEKLLATKDAIDVWIQPIYMKKGRAAHTLFCLFHDDTDGTNRNDSTTVSKLLSIIFQETTTLGIRIHRNIDRIALHRTFVKRVPITTTMNPDGNMEDLFVDVKIGYIVQGNEQSKDGVEQKNIMTVSPEFEHCKEIAIKTGIPLKTIMEEAKRKAKDQLDILDL